MKKLFAVTTLALAFMGTAQAGQPGQAIAERAVVLDGIVYTVQLSVDSTSYIQCKKGRYAARLLQAVEGRPGSTERMNLGCWQLATDGGVEYYGVDQPSGEEIHMLFKLSEFKELPGFTAWSDYKGPSMAAKEPGDFR